MIKTLFFLFLILMVPFLSYSQADLYTQSGYTSLIVKFSGDYPKDKDAKLTTPMYSNVLVHDNPTTFRAVNDSTLLLSFYTFGATRSYFSYDQGYCTTMLLPNQSDVLNIHYVDRTQYTMNYEGTFKVLFDHSKEYGEMIREALFSGNHISGQTPVSHETANDYRDSILEQTQHMITAVTKDMPSEMVRQLFRYDMEGVSKIFYLLDQVRYDLRAYRELETDSGKVKIPLIRDATFYDGLNIPRHTETEHLTGAAGGLFKTVRQDPLLALPDISGGNPEAYQNKLEEIFGSEGQSEKVQFYEIMVAGAYMDQVNAGTSLSEKQKLDIVRYFDNGHLSNYILHHDDLIPKGSQQGLAKYHLHFEEEKESVLPDILDRYKGKVVAVDFWATWCGPCIEAFGTMKGVKERFANDDVVFVYVAEESSDLGQWNNFANSLGGEHYYLYKNQSSYIHNQYGIKYIPSYLVFDKKGELIEKSLGEYMGNEKLEDWIRKGLKN